MQVPTQENTAENMRSTSPQRRCSQGRSAFCTRCVLELVLRAGCVGSGNYKHGIGIADHWEGGGGGVSCVVGENAGRRECGVCVACLV